MEKKIKKVSTPKKIKKTNKKVSGSANRVNKKNIKPMMIVNYTFLASLVLSIIFGFQTNMNFFIPFVIVLVITIVCMGIILVNAVYSKIKKMMNRGKKED